MTKLFISDLHLSPERPELIQQVCSFLKQHQETTSELYVLGDIFNTWLGDDLVPDEFTSFVDALKNYSKAGIRVFLMVGNRDFMLRKDFARAVGATLLEEPYTTELCGQKTILMHGDSLCTDDVSYQRYRKWVRNPFLQWCFLNLPLRFRQSISDKIKQKSRQKKRSKTAMIMDANQPEIMKVFYENKISLLIHGHTHRPDIHKISLDNGQQVYRVVLGDWQGEVSYLTVDDQQLTLHDHRLQDGIRTLRLF